MLDFVSQLENFNIEPYADIFERINNEKVEIRIETESKNNEYIEYDENSKIVTIDTLKLDEDNKLKAQFISYKL